MIWVIVFDENSFLNFEDSNLEEILSIDTKPFSSIIKRKMEQVYYLAKVISLQDIVIHLDKNILLFSIVI